MSLRCPKCGELESIKVIDTRPNADASVTRRRLQCMPCSYRFTTHERIDDPTIKARFDELAATLATAQRQLAELRRDRD